MSVVTRRIGYMSTLKHGDMSLALNWNWYPTSRYVAVYFWRLLITVKFPHRISRRDDSWKSWTLGTIEVTWFSAQSERS